METIQKNLNYMHKYSENYGLITFRSIHVHISTNRNIYIKMFK